MAVTMNLELETGINLQGAYIRIDTLNGYKKEIEISVNTYISREAFLNGAKYVLQNNYKFKPSIEESSENFIKQAYEYLKTIPNFKNAINVPIDGSPD